MTHARTILSLCFPLTLLLLAAPLVAQDLDLSLEPDAEKKPSAPTVPDAPGNAPGNAAGLELPKLPTPDHPELGYTHKIEAFKKKDVTYRLYLPPQYGKQPDRLFPSIYLQNPGGSPNVKRYTPWAKQRGVIIVGINRVSNGMVQHAKPPIQNAVLKDLDTRKIRVHPRLRFTLGMSGGSADGIRMVRRQGERFAGILIQGAGVLPSRNNCDHLVVALLHGSKDRIQSVATCLKSERIAEEQGNAFRMNIQPDYAHDWAPLDRQTRMLDWMIGLASITNPYLSDEEKTANKAVLVRDMRATPLYEDPGARRAEAERLLWIAPLRDEPEARTAVAAWLSAVRAQSERIEDPIERHVLLADALGSEVGQLLDEKQSAALKKQIEKLRENDAVAKDWKYRQMFRLVWQNEAMAGLDRDELLKVLSRYHILAESAAGTEWAAKARARMDEIRQYTNTKK